MIHKSAANFMPKMTQAPGILTYRIPLISNCLGKWMATFCLSIISAQSIEDKGIRNEQCRQKGQHQPMKVFEKWLPVSLSVPNCTPSTFRKALITKHKRPRPLDSCEAESVVCGTCSLAHCKAHSLSNQSPDRSSF